MSWLKEAYQSCLNFPQELLRCWRAQRIARWSKAQLGEQGERLAARYLQRQGWRIAARRYRSARAEIDLILIGRRPPTLVFVEVKTRRDARRGQPAEALLPRQQQRILQLSRRFLRQHRITDCRVRYDVVSIVWPTDGRRPSVRHLPDAFRPEP